MRRMYSKKQIGVITTSDEVVNQLATKLNPRYVKVIEAPTSTTLSDEQVEIFKSGVFVNGEFLGYKNPVFFPTSTYSDKEYGLFIGQVGEYGATRIGKYNINNKVISVSSVSMNIEYGGIITSFNGKTIPNYPASTGTFTLKSVDGVLTWVEDI